MKEPSFFAADLLTPAGDVPDPSPAAPSFALWSLIVAAVRGAAS